MTVAGMPLIELVARRASRSSHEVVVATSVETYDDLIARHLERVGIPVFRGSLDDVLGRFAAATADLGPNDRVVRLTGDNPVADAALVQELIAAVDASGHTYGRVDIDQVPEGLGAEVFTAAALRTANSQATSSYDREHVTPWLRRELGELLFAPESNPGDPVAYRCTTDCLNDYERISRLFDDEEDPVGVPWQALVAKLKANVDAAGPMAAVVGRPGRPRLTRVIVGTGGLGRVGSESDRDESIMRQTLATAVNRGVSHVVARAGQSELVHRGTFPALQQRLATLAFLPALDRADGDDPVDCRVRAAVERTRADLGQRAISAVCLASVSDALAADGAAWCVLREYVRAGVISEIGVRIGGAPESALLDAIASPPDFVVMAAAPDGPNWWADESATLRDLATSGVTVIADAGTAGPLVVRALLDVASVSSVVVNVADPQELDSVLTAAAGA